MTIRIDATVHRQQCLQLERLGVGHVTEAIGELEVDRRKPHGAGTRDVGDLHAGGLQCQDSRLRAFRVGREVDEDIQIIGSDACRHGTLVPFGKDLEMVGETAETRRPVIIHR